jgi:hypothetical protein
MTREEALEMLTTLNETLEFGQVFVVGKCYIETGNESEDDALIAALKAAAAEWCERTDRAESADDDDRFEYTFGELAE